MSIITLFKEELEFIKKYKNHTNFNNILVAFLNYPNEFRYYLHNTFLGLPRFFGSVILFFTSSNP